MVNGDLQPFVETFRTVARVLRLSGDAFQQDEQARAYFQALKSWPLSAVKVAAARCMAEAKYFPKPVEWIERMPKASTGKAAYPDMTADEAFAHDEAAALRFECGPCDCEECVEAGMTQHPRRFVPTLDDEHHGKDDGEIRKMYRGRMVPVGHWAHGYELARWYTARATFWADVTERFPGMAGQLKKYIGGGPVAGPERSGGFTRLGR